MQPRKTLTSKKASDEGPLETNRLKSQLLRDKRTRDVHEIIELGKQIRISKKQVNSQTIENLPIKMVPKTMIAPGARDASKFLSQKPQELRRFIQQMEDLWKNAGIMDNDEKKILIGKYADQDCEEEWEGLDSYERGVSWEEFKNKLIENYPEVAARKRGMPAWI